MHQLKMELTGAEKRIEGILGKSTSSRKAVLQKQNSNPFIGHWVSRDMLTNPRTQVWGEGHKFIVNNTIMIDYILRPTHTGGYNILSRDIGEYVIIEKSDDKMIIKYKDSNPFLDVKYLYSLSKDKKSLKVQQIVNGSITHTTLYGLRVQRLILTKKLKY